MRLIPAVLAILLLAAPVFATWECEWEEKKAKDPYSHGSMNEALAEETSVGKIAGLAVLRIYHTFLSGRTGGHCVFHPSCSRYSYYSVKKYGLIKGIIMSNERLFRCHGWSHDYNYPHDYETSLLSDPVEANNTFNFIFDWMNF